MSDPGTGAAFSFVPDLRVLRREVGTRDDWQREWSRTFAAIHPLVMERLRGLVAWDESADDLAAAAMRRALRSINTYQEDGPFLHWVHVIARKALGKERKKQARRRAKDAVFATYLVVTESDEGVAAERIIQRLTLDGRLPSLPI